MIKVIVFLLFSISLVYGFKITSEQSYKYNTSWRFSYDNILFTPDEQYLIFDIYKGEKILVMFNLTSRSFLDQTYMQGCGIEGSMYYNFINDTHFYLMTNKGDWYDQQDIILIYEHHRENAILELLIRKEFSIANLYYIHFNGDFTLFVYYAWFGNDICFGPITNDFNFAKNNTCLAPFGNVDTSIGSKFGARYLYIEDLSMG